MKERFTNPDIVTIAVYLLGGDSSHVDIEDVAMKANDISPGRFAWRKYPEQVNIFQISNSLSDARKEKNGSYVMGSMQSGWMLTDKGLEFARKRVRELENADLSRKPQTAKERRWEKGERGRLISEPAFIKYHDGQQNDISQAEAEAFFRVNDYVVEQAREKKIIRILNAFGADPEIEVVAQALVSRVRGK